MFPFVATLSHWYQGWVEAAIGFETELQSETRGLQVLAQSSEPVRRYKSFVRLE